MPSLFVSRHLGGDSVLRIGLEQRGWQVVGHPLIRIIPLDFAMPQHLPEWVFFSSANGAGIFLGRARPEGRFRIGAVGQGTARAVERMGWKVGFIGESGDSAEVGRRLAGAVGSGRVLFVCAEGGSPKVRQSLADGQFDVLPVYRTSPEAHATVPITDVAFLTSPSNAAVFLEQRAGNSAVLIAIGRTTAEFLERNGESGFLELHAPTEEEALQAVLGLRLTEH